MSFDTTGLTEVKMRKYRGQQGSYYLNDQQECVAKTCSTCLQVVSSSAFNRHKGKKYGLHNDCRTCHRLDSGARGSDPEKGTRAQRSRNRSRSDEQVLRDREILRPSGKKKCQSCQEVLALAEYSRCRAWKDGLRAVCRGCQNTKNEERHGKAFVQYWSDLSIPLACYLCGGQYEEIEHLIPRSRGGSFEPVNTRPSCMVCNRGRGGKHGTPLEEYIFSVNHPTKTRAKILYEIVMSGAWPFAKTTPDEFATAFNAYDKEALCT